MTPIITRTSSRPDRAFEELGGLLEDIVSDIRN
ncbi:MAG: hypothetical protein JWO28_836 [Hyphomicrobiales bacterium]|nr:hypothetical protein [Hyphomicrobiales bacterium]